MAEEKKYTAGEEIANAISHMVGVMFSIYAIVMLAVMSKNPAQTASSTIFGATMFILFQASACYHAITNEFAKKVCKDLSSLKSLGIKKEIGKMEKSSLLITIQKESDNICLEQLLEMKAELVQIQH